ncbi:mannosyltransferase [Lithohypha guttulata]|nr:mannosyltransferase [Lithohypha guttulata]
MSLTKRRVRGILFGCLLCAVAVAFASWIRRPVHEANDVNSAYFSDVVAHSLSHRMGAHSHHDTRFAPNTPMPDEELRSTLHALLKNYVSVMTALEIKSWMAHGTLLGWYWNKRLLPWDTDLDVHVSMQDLQVLAGLNASVFPGAEGQAGTYLLDVNQYFADDREDPANRIDARWIDTENGKFMDITAVRQEAGSDWAKCKDGHRYLAFRRYHFDAATKLWQPDVGNA